MNATIERGGEKMSKRISILLTMVVLLVSLAIPVQAASTYANTMSHSLTFTNTTANCGLTVVAEKSNYSITIVQGNTIKLRILERYRGEL